MTPAARLRELVDSPDCLLAPGVYNALFAKQAEHEGFEAVFVGAFSVAASLGLSALSLMSLAEMATIVQSICRSVTIPVIADGDTGYGNAMNTIRTVQELERAGAAAMLLGDRSFPADLLYGGDQLTPLAEQAQKVRAAVEAKQDANFLVIARTDALALYDWDEAERRAAAYRDAGADLVLVEGVRTRDDAIEYSARFARRGMPTAYSGGVIGIQEAGRSGFKVQILANLSLKAVQEATAGAMRSLMETGLGSYRGDIERAPKGESMNDLLGVPQIYELERRYGIGLDDSVVETQVTRE